VSNGSLDTGELDLLRTMIEADELASSDGHRDEPFAVLRLNGNATFLDHPGLHGRRPRVSPRAFAGLQEAGLFTVVSETESMVRVYLARDARTWLERRSTAGADPPATALGMGDDQDRLLQVIFEHFRGSAEWPIVDELRHELDQTDDDLDVLKIGQELDPDLGTVKVGFGGQASLTLRGVARCAGSEEVLDDVLRSVLLAYGRFRRNGLKARIAGEDLERELGLDPLRLRRTHELVQWLPGVGGGQSSAPNVWYRETGCRASSGSRCSPTQVLLAGLSIKARQNSPSLLPAVRSSRSARSAR
jgi:hypothetical protein